MDAPFRKANGQLVLYIVTTVLLLYAQKQKTLETLIMEE